MAKNKLAAFALLSAFTLLSALPAAAADRPTKGASGITTSGASNGKGQLVFQPQSAQRPPFFTSAPDCVFQCGGLTVTCSGDVTSCTSSSCTTGNLSATCVQN